MGLHLFLGSGKGILPQKELPPFFQQPVAHLELQLLILPAVGIGQNVQPQRLLTQGLRRRVKAHHAGEGDGEKNTD